jgi:hypothetical protein
MESIQLDMEAQKTTEEIHRHTMIRSWVNVREFFKISELILIRESSLIPL